MQLSKPRNYLPLTPSPHVQENWERKSQQFRTEKRICADLQLGDLFRLGINKNYWLQLAEIIPQNTMPGFLLIRSILLPDGIEGCAYFPADCLIEVVQL